MWENEIFAQLIYKEAGGGGAAEEKKRDNKSSQSVCFSLLESSDFLPRLVLSAIPNRAMFLQCSRILYVVCAQNSSIFFSFLRWATESVA